MTQPRTKATACFLVLSSVWALLLLASNTWGANTPTGLHHQSAKLRLHFDRDVPKGESPALMLKGAEAMQQILVSATLMDGSLRDVTHEIILKAEPEGRVAILPGGRVRALQDGDGTLTACWGETLSTSLAFKVEGVDTPRPINFPNHLVPIFTKTGCNGGGCHGKSEGQNGFRLSLLGFEPEEDYEFILSEAKGRRIFPAAPERSLLLLKATAELPHGGGKRMEKDSDEYRLLKRWIAQGMPYGNPQDPTLDRIEVIPSERIMALEGRQQLVVMAHYSDGSTEDVTRSALYEANQPEMAQISSEGTLQLYRQPGDLSVMIRYHGKVATFRTSIPLGMDLAGATWPAAHHFIDELVFAKLKKLGMPPSERCDDTTFLRRVSLDLAGRLPTEDEALGFLSDPDPLKRERAIDRLLESGDYADFFANKFSALLRNRRDDDRQRRGSLAFHRWIRNSLYENTPYDRFVTALLTATGDMAQNPPVAWYRQVNQTQEQLEDTAQLFLATRLKCAQCHHHPYERWSQKDYYQFSAYFSRLGREGGSQPGEDILFHRHGKASTTHPKTRETLLPVALGAEAVEVSPEEDPQASLAAWMTDPANPFFAPALVNRYWKHFLNRGLVEPEDDMRATNPPSNPALLEALADHFIRSGFDLKDLARQICRSETYQLSALPNAWNAVDTQHFSHHYPQRMEAEVLLDAIDSLTQTQTSFAGLPSNLRAVQLPDNSFNKDHYFLTVFGRPDSASACECERSTDASLAQSLHLLNAKGLGEKLSNHQGRAAAFANDVPQKDEANLRSLYLQAFARQPTQRELEEAMNYLHRPGRMELNEAGEPVPMAPEKARREAIEDLIWVLLNTKEFLFNH